MVDIGNFIKDAAKTGLEKGVREATGGGFNTGFNTIIDTITGGLAQNLYNSGNAFNVIDLLTGIKLDSVIAGGSEAFSGFSGKCPERASATDVAKNRAPVVDNLQKYMQEVLPATAIPSSIYDNKTNVFHALEQESTKYYIRLRFYPYDRSDLFKKASQKLSYTVVLPLPIELTDSQGSEYQTADMKTVGTLMSGQSGAGMQAVLLAGETAIDQAGNLVSSLVNKVSPAAGKVLGAGADLASAAGFNAQNIMNGVEQYLGAAPNPYPSVLFQGPRLREFNFSWTFNPRSAEESRRIREIVQKLKASSLPGLKNGQDHGVLTYPDLCMINFYPWDSSTIDNTGIINDVYEWTNRSFIRIKRCFISNISTNYAPNGVPAFFAGTRAPVFIQLNITLREVEFFTAEDWSADVVRGSGDGNGKAPEVIDPALSTLGALNVAGG